MPRARTGRKLLLGLAACLMLPWCAALTRADETLRPSHQCAPENALLLARIPQGKAFFDALRAQTKLGATVLSAERFDRFIKAFAELNDESWSQFRDELAKYGIKLEDAARLFDGEVGFALVMQDRGDRLPLFVGLSWIEPGDDLAARLVSALEKVIESQKSEEHPVARVDLDLAGHKVMRLTIPAMGLDVDLSDEPLGGIVDEEDFEKRHAERQKRLEAAKQVEIDQTHIFVTRVGNRLLLANTIPQSAAEVRKLLADPAQKPNLPSITGAEEAAGVFARFLAAHQGDVGAESLFPRVMATPGLSAALPDGLPLIEILFDPQPLLKLAASSGEQAAQVMKVLGVDGIGPMGLRVAFDKNVVRTGLMISAPEPRAGLLTLLNQPALAPEPPAWVPASAISYGHISFDLGQAYARIKELVIGQFGDEVKSGFDMVEQQVTSATKLDLTGLLSSLGTQHTFVTFEPRTAPQRPAGEEGAAAAAILAPTSREAIVWQVKDEEPWKRLIQLGAGFAAASGGTVKASQEQGFVGLRANIEGMFEGGVFLGRNHLIVGIGPDVVEPVMSSLRTPPEGENSLRTNPIMKQAAELQTLEPGMAFQVTDNNRSIKASRQLVITMLDALMGDPLFSGGPLSVPGVATTVPVEPDAESAAEAEKTKAMLTKFKELIPTEEELEGAMGVGVGQLTVTAQGLVYRGATLLPPPK